jgi:predicted AAA+ superfamily ATPase
VGAQAGKEVDFIAVRQEERMYVQVAYLLASPETVERAFSVLSAIADHYPNGSCPWIPFLSAVGKASNGAM